MKKKTFAIVGLALILGAIAGFSTHFVIELRANTVMALAEEAQSSIDEASVELTEEEKGKLQAIVDELYAKYEEIKNIQVAGTTIGAIVGALVGAIVSAIPALLNRANIKKAIENVEKAQIFVDALEERAKQLEKDHEITNKNYALALEAIHNLSTELSTVKGELKKTQDNYGSLKKDNAELKQIIVIMANHTKEFVADGTAELINKLIAAN